MIFKSVSSLEGTAEKNYYKEKIGVLIKTVDAVCSKQSIPYSSDEEGVIERIIEIGLIDSPDEITLLQSTLTKPLFRELIRAVATINSDYELFRPFIQNLSNAERKKLQAAEMQRNAPTLVDLFCGAGGLSLGFKQNGFKTLFANDFDSLCIETYKYNHPEIPSDVIVCGDIREISKNIGERIHDEVDVVIGGPPCQGFSSANKHHRVIDDPRNELYKYFLKSVEQLAPKIVVMENVKGMLKVADQVVEDYENLRVIRNGNTYTYSVYYELLNSADFSVAQSRERLIYIAVRSDLTERLGVLPRDLFEQIHANNEGGLIFNLADALEGVRSLEAPHVMNVGEIDTQEGGRKIDVNPFEGTENAYLRLINQNRQMPLVYNHKARYCSELNYEIYKRMNPGDDATDPKIADIMPYAHRNDKFKDKYYRLYADRPCRTITAHLRSDCHSHIHPYEDRAITPREAARVQSFPDDYLFLGPYLKTYIQIGNAVPTVMARGIAQTVRHYLEADQ